MAGGNGPEDFCSVLIILSPVLAQQFNRHLTNAVYLIWFNREVNWFWFSYV